MSMPQTTVPRRCIVAQSLATVTTQGGDMVQMLLGNGADFNLKTKSGDTVLLTATGQGHNAIVQLLLDQANPQLKPKPGT